MRFLAGPHKAQYTYYKQTLERLIEATSVHIDSINTSDIRFPYAKLDDFYNGVMRLSDTEMKISFLEEFNQNVIGRLMQHHPKLGGDYFSNNARIHELKFPAEEEVAEDVKVSSSL